MPWTLSHREADRLAFLWNARFIVHTRHFRETETANEPETNNPALTDATDTWRQTSLRPWAGLEQAGPTARGRASHHIRVHTHCGEDGEGKDARSTAALSQATRVRARQGQGSWLGTHSPEGSLAASIHGSCVLGCARDQYLPSCLEPGTV